MRTSTTLIAGAALVAAVACGKSNDSASGAQGQNAGRASDVNNAKGDGTGQPVTLEGCLQQGGGTFAQELPGLRRQQNKPTTTGTAGSVTSSGSAVEREQMRMAANTYRLDPRDDINLKDMVGRQVRVSGTGSEQAKSPNGSGALAQTRTGSDRTATPATNRIAAHT